jgi:hypothetical protein
MVMAPNGTLITEAIAKEMVEAGIQRISGSHFRLIQRSRSRTLSRLQRSKSLP